MAKKKKIKIAVAGLGRIGWSTHCKVLGGKKNYQLAAVVDTDKDRLREAEETFGCRSYTSYEGMLKEEKLDVVTIATPTHLHKDMSIKAFKAGVGVFLEKPMAINLKESKQIAAAAKKHKKLLTIYQPHRALAYYQQLLDIINKGMLGTVYHVKRGMFNFTQRNDWQSLKKYGGGMLANYGAHTVDQLLYLTGYDVKKVYCNTRKVASLGDADDVVKILYETRQSVVGEIDINQALTVSPYEMQVYGTNGSAVLDKGKKVWQVTCFKKKDLPWKKLETSLTASGRKYPSDNVKFTEKAVKVSQKMEVDVYDDLYDALTKRKKPLVLPEQVISNMKLLDECRRIAGRVQVTPIV
ncbi:MAG: Gfo/Idh/MocA family protein [Planctomycetota bacterium]